MLGRQAETVARQQELIARQTSRIKAESSQRLAQAEADIHEQMDKFDAPRIPLPPMPPAPPAVVASPAAAVTTVAQTAAAAAPADAKAKPAVSANTSGAKPKHEAAKATVDSIHRDKDKSKSPASWESNAARSTADAKPAESETGEVHQSPAARTKLVEKHQASSITVAKPDSPAGSPPAWINNSTKRVGDTWQELVVTDEYATPEECYREADRLLLLTTRQHLQTLIGDGDGSYEVARTEYSTGHNRDAATNAIAAELSKMGITIDYVRRKIAKKEWLATRDHDFGPMKKLYTLVEFSSPIDRELEQCWDAYHRQTRLAMVGVGAGSIVGLLGLAFALLKIDTLTKGYYTKRLFIGVPAAIILGLLLMGVVGHAL